MECLHEDDGGIRIIRLAGRMDIEGNDEIALRFNTLTVTGGPSIIVDLSGVEFLGSIGIGTLGGRSRRGRSRWPRRCDVPTSRAPMPTSA